MTDADIIKALELCGSKDRGQAVCPNCPAQDKCYGDEGLHALERAALDLINRQQAEIERLKKHNLLCAQLHYNDGREDLTKKIVEQLKEAAIKENVPAYIWDVQADYYLPLSKAIEIVEGGANE